MKRFTLQSARLVALFGMILSGSLLSWAPTSADVTCYDFDETGEPKAVMDALPNDPFGIDTGWPLPSGLGSGDQEAGNGIACDSEKDIPENESPGNEEYPISANSSANGLDQLPDGEFEEATIQSVVYSDAVQTAENPSKFYSVMSVSTPEFDVYADYEDHDVTGQCGAYEATTRLQELLAPGTKVWLEVDEAGFFTQTMLDRHIWVQLDGKFRLVSEILVSEGHAVVTTERPGMGRADAVSNPPNGSMYRDALRTAQKQAIESGVGLWSACA